MIPNEQHSVHPMRNHNREFPKSFELDEFIRCFQNGVESFCIRPEPDSVHEGNQKRRRRIRAVLVDGFHSLFHLIAFGLTEHAYICRLNHRLDEDFRGF